MRRRFSSLDLLDAEFRRALGRHPEPGPAAMLGVEHEYTLRLADEPVDFRGLIHQLPVDGRRLDPGDPNAYRLAWGGSLTADGREAEVATPPVARRPGFAVRLDGLARRGRCELEDLLGALPAPIAVDGYSTHANVAMPPELNERASRLYASTFAPALMLLMDRAESPGLIVRPRPGRMELCGEFVEGEHLRAVAAFAAGSVRACAGWAAGLKAARRRLPPRLRTAVEPATMRYGWFVGRGAFGPDLYAEGREALLRRRRGGTIRAQDQLELAWEAARAALENDVDPEDIRVATELVEGRLALPVEGGIGGAGDQLEDDPIEDIPFRELIVVRDRPGFRLRPALATWDFTLFEVAPAEGEAEGAEPAEDPRVAFASVPRDSAGEFVRALSDGRLDGAMEGYLAEPPVGRVLAQHAQTSDPGLFDQVGNPADLLPKEQEPAGATSVTADPLRPGKHHGNGHDRKARRPRRWGRFPAWGVIAAIVAFVIVAAIVGAVALGGGKSKPVVATKPTVSSPAATASSTVSPTTSPSPSPTVLPPKPPNSLAGAYRVTITVEKLATTVIGVKVGDHSQGDWILTTKCKHGTCAVDLIGATRDNNKIQGHGPIRGGAVEGPADSGLNCVSNSTGAVEFVFNQVAGQFAIHVTKSQSVLGVPQAAAFKGDMRFSWTPPAGKHLRGCDATSEVDGIEGTLIRAPKLPPAPTTGPPPPVSDAALVGTWNTTLSVVSAKGIPGKKPGQELRRLYVFIPKCPDPGTCGLRLVREGSNGVFEDELKAEGNGVFTERLDQTIACRSGSEQTHVTLLFRIGGARLIDGVWRATQVTGVFQTKVVAAPGASSDCASTFERDRITATLVG